MDITSLIDDVLLLILSYLPAWDLRSLGRSCSFFRSKLRSSTWWTILLPNSSATSMISFLLEWQRHYNANYSGQWYGTGYGYRGHFGAEITEELLDKIEYETYSSFEHELAKFPCSLVSEWYDFLSIYTDKFYPLTHFCYGEGLLLNLARDKLFHCPDIIGRQSSRPMISAKPWAECTPDEIKEQIQQHQASCRHEHHLGAADFRGKLSCDACGANVNLDELRTQFLSISRQDLRTYLTDLSDNHRYRIQIDYDPIEAITSLRICLRNWANIIVQPPIITCSMIDLIDYAPLIKISQLDNLPRSMCQFIAGHDVQFRDIDVSIRRNYRKDVYHLLIDGRLYRYSKEGLIVLTAANLNVIKFEVTRWHGIFFLTDDGRVYGFGRHDTIANSAAETYEKSDSEDSWPLPLGRSSLILRGQMLPPLESLSLVERKSVAFNYLCPIVDFIIRENEELIDLVYLTIDGHYGSYARDLDYQLKYMRVNNDDENFPLLYPKLPADHAYQILCYESDDCSQLALLI